jgi:hypothetical protein
MSNMQDIKRVHGIFELYQAKMRKKNLYVRMSVLFMFVMLIFGFIGTTLPQGPIWAQSGISIAIFLVILVSPILSVILMQMSNNLLGFEKTWFLKVYNAYSFLSRFNSLQNCSAQEINDLKKAADILKSASAVFRFKKVVGPRSDITKEIDLLYNSIGELIETRVIPAIENKKDLNSTENVLFEIASTLADNSVSRMNNLKDNLSVLPELRTLHQKPVFFDRFDNHPTVKSMLWHVIRLFVSLGSVILVAFILSFVFQFNVASLTPYILGSSIALFVGWEFKSKK